MQEVDTPVQLIEIICPPVDSGNKYGFTGNKMKAHKVKQLDQRDTITKP